MRFAKSRVGEKSKSSEERIREVRMKRLLVFILVLSFLVITGTLVSADGKTRWNKSAFERSVHITTEATDVIR
jgi:hypothetical protein